MKRWIAVLLAVLLVAAAGQSAFAAGAKPVKGDLLTLEQAQKLVLEEVTDGQAFSCRLEVFRGVRCWAVTALVDKSGSYKQPSPWGQSRTVSYSAYDLSTYYLGAADKKLYGVACLSMANELPNLPNAFATAKETALAKVPGGTLVGCEVGFDIGQTTGNYRMQVLAGNTLHDLLVSSNGKTVEHQMSHTVAPDAATAIWPDPAPLSGELSREAAEQAALDKVALSGGVVRSARLVFWNGEKAWLVRVATPAATQPVHFNFAPGNATHESMEVYVTMDGIALGVRPALYIRYFETPKEFVPEPWEDETVLSRYEGATKPLN